jgi:NAD(P)-dependent dehydrogenase (short-subunit alcohol dehydrogenase family)
LITSRFDASSTAAGVVAGLDLRGRRALVTGGAGGMGREIALALHGAGAAVIAADVEPAALPGIETRRLDLASLGAVRRFAADWAGAPLDMLIANAGVMACPLARSAEGHELQFAVNHLGHWLLAVLLRPALAAAAQAHGEARIVSVSSIAHRRSGIVFEDINYRARPYDRWEAYGQSKTACALMAVAATERFASDGITCNALNPGGAFTGLMRHLTPAELRAQGWIDENGQVPARWRSAAQCAATATWAATAPALRGIGGRYFEECREADPWDPAQPMRGLQPHARDPAIAQRLWEVSEAMVAQGARG